VLQATLFRGSGSGDRTLFEVELERRDRVLFLAGRVLSDEGGVIRLPPIPLAGGPHVLDVGWRRASSPTSRDGVFALQLDGVDAGGVPSLDNDRRGGVESVELGLALRAFPRPAGAPRFVRLDSFQSWRLP
jgi:hypothetical protein